MADFQITEIGEKAWCVLDDWGASWYVLEGRDRAAVIDTGITAGEKITPVIRRLTQKPLVLLVTHAHIDHLHHIDEFSTVYMSHQEFTMGEEILQKMTGGISYDLHQTIDIDTDSQIDLGDDRISVCACGGHTPGSVVFLDEKRNLLFTGDAIGSGAGVWLQVPGTLTLEEYLPHLIGLQKWLVAKGGRMKFYGGHSYQVFQSVHIREYNPLNMGLLGDLIDLVDGLIRGTIVGMPSNARKSFDPRPKCYAAFGRAEIVYDPERIHKAG